MMNFTSIDDLIQKSSAHTTSKEAEPAVSREKIQEGEEPEEKNAEIKEYVEEVPNAPDVPPDLKKMGVQSTPSVAGSIIIGNKKLDLPLPLEEVSDGLSKPVTSGKRWLAEFIKYVLFRLHLVIKRIHGTLTVVKK